MGSIPACAGEPEEETRTLDSYGVYPRVCGGTESTTMRKRKRMGLSPRVRGNPRRRCTGSSRLRSIPACAGEPLTDGERIRRNTVYPRVCGGTVEASSKAMSATGLSPRVRGNRLTNLTQSTVERSIPACAGEPHSHRHSHRPASVYPRVCGGTTWIRARRRHRQGLSPRVRGNR